MSEQVTTTGEAASADETPSSGGRRMRLPSSAGRSAGLVIALLVLILVGWITAGSNFMSLDNMLVILRLASVIGVVAIGVTFVITAGGIDLSVGSVLGLADRVVVISDGHVIAERPADQIDEHGVLDLVMKGSAA